MAPGSKRSAAAESVFLPSLRGSGWLNIALSWHEPAGLEPVRRLYLTGASDPGHEVMPYPFLDKCKLNVDCDWAGVAHWLDWHGEIAEIALFERKYRSSACDTMSQE
jgi:hypothetical protein